MELQNSVRQAKKNYWNSVVAEAKSLPQAYKIVQWHNTAPRYQCPPLKSSEGNDPVFDPSSKAHLFHQKLLCRYHDAEDLPDNVPIAPIRSIPWNRISNNEAHKAACQVKSTSPGSDELKVTSIRLSWSLLGERITNPFNCRIEIGIHPKAFKTAKVIILPKCGTRDLSSPNSYRPIALLSCLGKGLERLIARRLSYWALQYKILALNQCGAIKHRSASDLTTALLCDVRQAWERKKLRA